MQAMWEPRTKEGEVTITGRSTATDADPRMTGDHRPHATVEPLRLAFLADPASVHSRRWMSRFLERGHQIHLMLPAHDPEARGLDPRIVEHRFDAWPRTRIPGIGSIVTAVALHRLLERVQPDVVHAHSLNRYGIAAWLGAYHPYVITVWGSDVLIVVRETRRSRLRARLALRGADLVTGGSQLLVRAAIEAGARPDRTRYIHLGIDTARFAPGAEPVELRQRLGLEGCRVVLSNRTIAPLYRQLVVVEALAMLPADVVALMTMHLAKQDEVERVRSRAAELDVAHRVRIVPEQPEAVLPDLYRLADVVVSLPVSDGGPTTVAEALATGRPVVATDLPSAREWLGELDPEALVPPDDPRATAGAILRELGRTSADRQGLGQRGRAAVEARASEQRNMDEMESLYLRLARRRSSGARRSRIAPEGPPREDG